MILLDGKKVAEKIEKGIEEKIKKIKAEKNITPYIAILGMNGNESSLTYIKKIQKNCEKYGIKSLLKLSETENEFIEDFEKIEKNQEITGIMFQQPLPPKIFELINQIPSEKDIEGISDLNIGKLFTGKKEVNIPCTSKAVIETLDFYNID